MIPGKTYTPQDLLEIVWRRKWLLLLPLVVSGLAAAGYAHYLPDKYRSDTLILVVPQRVPESYVRSTVTTRIEDRLQSIQQQILSRTRLERIVQDFGLYPDLVKAGIMEDVVEHMRQDISTFVEKGDAFRVAYVSDDRRRAMQVTERLASLFIDENLRDREVLAEDTNQFLDAQLQDARRRLIESEQKIELYRRQHQGELPSQLESNLQGMQGAQMQLQAVVDSLNRDRDRRMVLERTLGDLNAQISASGATPAPAAVPMATIEQPAVVSATNADQLAAARRLLRELELRLRPAHPDIARVKRVIEDLEKKTEADAAATAVSIASGMPQAPADQALNLVNATRQVKSITEEMANIDRQVASKELEQTRLKTVIAEFQRRVDTSPTRESEITELTRDYSTLQTFYTSLLGKSEDAKISANLERRQIGEQFKVLDAARLPERPFTPDRPRIALLGALFGLGVGVGLSALLEYRDTTLKTDADVLAALGLPVLALVPVLESAADHRRRQRRKLWLSLASAATVVLTVAAVFFVWKLKLLGS